MKFEVLTYRRGRNGVNRQVLAELDELNRLGRCGPIQETARCVRSFEVEDKAVTVFEVERFLQVREIPYRKNGGWSMNK